MRRAPPTHGQADWALAIEALIWLGLTGAALRLLSFKALMRLAAWPLGGVGLASDADRVGWAVCAAARRWPGRPACFQQGLAAQIMLRRRGLASRLFYGARSNGAQGPRAHVWVRLADRDVVGGGPTAHYAVLAVAPSSDQAD